MFLLCWRHGSNHRFPDNEIQIPGYSCVRSDRLHKKGGGTMAYVRDGIPYRLRPDLGASLPESCVIEISRPKCKKLIIWTMYRAPDSNLETFIQDLNTSLSSVPVKTELILLGDFNINCASSEMNNDKAKKHKLLQVANVHHLDQVINTSMRITETLSTLIELLFTNTSHCVIDRGFIPSPLSDHCLIFCVIKSGVPKAQGRTSEYRSYKHYSKQESVNDLKEIDWNQALNKRKKVFAQTPLISVWNAH